MNYHFVLQQNGSIVKKKRVTEVTLCGARYFTSCRVAHAYVPFPWSIASRPQCTHFTAPQLLEHTAMRCPRAALVPSIRR